MKRTNILRVFSFLAVAGAACTTWAHQGGSIGGQVHNQGQSSGVRQTTFHAPITTIYPIGLNPTLPVGPIGPGKFPIGPIGPIKPPGSGGGNGVDPIPPLGPI